MQSTAPTHPTRSRDIPGSVRLTESAIMLAFAVILSMLAIIKLPFGGDVTAFSMLPILIVAYRYGTRWGLFTGFVFSLLQMVLGTNNLAWATTWTAAAAIIFLDYIVAFTCLGLGGIFRRMIPSQGGALAAGAVLACLIRYACHVVSGCTVWIGVSIPSSDSLLYSMAYNATYMLPETLITVVGAFCLSGLLDFRRPSIARMAAKEKAPDLAVLLAGLGKIALAAGAVIDCAAIFPVVLSETTVFDPAKWGLVNWPFAAIVTAGGILLCALLHFAARQVPADGRLSLTWLFSLLPFAALASALALDGWMIYRAVGRFTGPLDAQSTGQSVWSVYYMDVIEISLVTAALVIAAVLVVRRFLRRRGKSGPA